MDRFSIRNEYQVFEGKELRGPARMRIWQVFAKQYVLGNRGNAFNIVEDLLSYIGKQYVWTYSAFDHRDNVQMLQRYICSDAEWYKVIDFVEYVIKHDLNGAHGFTELFNEILEDEKTGYYIVAGVVTPLVNDAEITAVTEAYDGAPQHVAESIKKALKLYSDIEKPDYSNAVKEMITAVEALCCTIVGGTENTLGAAVNKLSEYGVELNEFLSDAIKKLYKYTCNEEGVRHGGTEIKDVPIEDARFMIIICSAIINYLVAKWGERV